MVADALVGTHHVLADTVGADSARRAALVDVFARLPVRRQFVAGWADAVEGARRVHTRAAPAQSPVA